MASVGLTEAPSGGAALAEKAKPVGGSFGSELPSSPGGIISSHIETGVKENPSDLLSVIQQTDRETAAALSSPPDVADTTAPSADSSKPFGGSFESYRAQVLNGSQTNTTETPPSGAATPEPSTATGDETVNPLSGQEDFLGRPYDPNQPPAGWANRGGPPRPASASQPEPAAAQPSVEPVVPVGMKAQHEAQRTVSERIAAGEPVSDTERAEAQRQAAAAASPDILTSEQKNAQDLIDAIASNGGSLSTIAEGMQRGEKFQNPLTNQDLTPTEVQSALQRQQELAAQKKQAQEASEPEATPSTPQTEQAPTRTTKTETEAKKQQLKTEQQTLIDKRKNGTPLTEDEVNRLGQISKELNELDKDPQAILESALQKAQEGKIDELTPAEKAALTNQEAKQLTPEQQLEQVKKDLEEVGRKLMNGEGNQAENFQKLRELQDKVDGVRTSQQDKEDAALFAEMYLKDPRELSKRFAKESETQRQVREEIQKLLALEAQLANMPMIIEKKREEKKRVKEQVDRLRDRMDQATNASDRAARTAEWAPKARLLAQLRNEIKLMKDADIITRQERRDLLRSIDGKLGMNKGWRALVRWSTDQAANGFDSIHLSINARFDDE